MHLGMSTVLFCCGAAALQHPVALRRRHLESELRAFGPSEIQEVSVWASEQNNPVGFGAIQVLAIVVCFPATVLFDLGAGYAFGPVIGTCVSWVAKVVAAMISFYLAVVFRPAGVGAAAERFFQDSPRLSAIAADVEAKGLEYTVISRLSPIPSWANNYGLALAGVGALDYFWGTAVASLPAVATHSVVGSSLSSLSAGGASTPSSLLGALGAVSAVVLLRRLSAAASGNMAP